MIGCVWRILGRTTKANMDDVLARERQAEIDAWPDTPVFDAASFGRIAEILSVCRGDDGLEALRIAREAFEKPPANDRDVERDLNAIWGYVSQVLDHETGGLAPGDVVQLRDLERDLASSVLAYRKRSLKAA